MTTDQDPAVPEVGPRDAWEILSRDERSVLVDVRTGAELTFVGRPDLSEVGKDVVLQEWQTWPELDHNPAFAETLLGRVGENPSQILFLCRSGARSRQAARAVAEALRASGGSATCLNVTDGFEGEVDEKGHRGGLNGWKAQGLAWRQP